MIKNDDSHVPALAGSCPARPRPQKRTPSSSMVDGGSWLAWWPDTFWHGEVVALAAPPALSDTSESHVCSLRKLEG